MTPTVLSAIACIACALVGWAIGYRLGSRDGRAIGWLERYYAELDAATKRAQWFGNLHPRQGGKFAPRVNGNGRN